MPKSRPEIPGRVPCDRKLLADKALARSPSKHSPNPWKAVRSDRIHAVFHGLPLHGPDESGHYKLVVRMLTSPNCRSPLTIVRPAAYNGEYGPPAG